MRTILTLSLLIACFTSMTAQQRTDEAPRVDLIPLVVGNSWTYEVDKSSTRYRSDDEDEIAVLTLSREVKLAGQTFVAVPLGKQELFLANADSGVYIWHDDEARAMLMFPYPSKPGVSHILKLDRSAVKIEVMSIEERVAVGGDVYTCYRYRMSNPEGDEGLDAYIAPGVGVVRVKADPKPHDDDPPISIQLMKHTLKTIEKVPASDVD